ncbi:MAG TPA: 2-dehydro-3-deoxygalactonokinase [Roseobacter sp.]|nr:2-dehydro-3-deoxygalactonokinase [Roseobacter sp.]
MNTPDVGWIAVDFAARGVQIWAHDTDSNVLQQEKLRPSEIGEELASLLHALEPYLSNNQTIPVICSGYSPLPAPVFLPVPSVLTGELSRLAVDDPRVSVLTTPGLKQARPVGLMHGSATAISGFLAATPDFDGVVCTVSKKSHWSHISAGEVVSFQSFLTPELAGLLASKLSLKNGLGPSDLDEHAFDIAVDEIMTRPERFAASLAQISAGATLNEISPTTGYSQLMGGLIGMELSGARPYWLGRQVSIIASDPWGELYARALKAQGVQAMVKDRAPQILAGLQHSYRTWCAKKN